MKTTIDTHFEIPELPANADMASIAFGMKLARNCLQKLCVEAAKIAADQRDREAEKALNIIAEEMVNMPIMGE